MSRIVGDHPVLLPNEKVDLSKWCVVACDQFTSEPEYWADVEKVVGDAPSTLKVIYPEVFLKESKEEKVKRIKRIQDTMKEYVSSGVLQPHMGLIYIERVAGGNLRRGILASVDLEEYAYDKGTHTAIRPTEGTVVERLPPRKEIRLGAPIELPHIMLLIDDPAAGLVEKIDAMKEELEKVYDVELMLKGGTLKGWRLNERAEKLFRDGLDALVEPEAQRKMYGKKAVEAPLLFAVGDGNHSLATAKATWEDLKATGGVDKEKHPARFALVEIVNIHDPGLFFEPIHRVLFNLISVEHVLGEMQKYFGDRYSFADCPKESLEEKIKEMGNRPPHNIGFISPKKCGIITIANPTEQFAVGTLQPFIDQYIKDKEDVDYIHGSKATWDLGTQEGKCGFMVPSMMKSELFEHVVNKGPVMRKTFSMGEAEEKRYYLEARTIL